MKCAIVKDLLPLYIDNLCSEDSEEMLKEHLSQCEDCRRYYSEMTDDISPEENVEKTPVEEYLQDKDLLLKSKNMIKMSFARKIVKTVNIMFILLNIIVIICGATFLCSEYGVKYPEIDLDIKFLFLYLGGLLPSIVAVAELCTINRVKHYMVRMVSNILMQFISAVVCLVSVICMFVIIPPLESFTENPENYLVVDKEVEEYKDIYEAFFPISIPENAEAVEYRYLKKEGIFSGNITISASWVLPQGDYSEAKNNILKNYYAEEMKDGSYQVTISGIRYPGKADLNFTYEDNSRRVTYSFHADKHF